MNIKESIRRADMFRTNTIEERQKYSWVYDLDGRWADITNQDIPADPFPKDAELLIPHPYDNVYELYLMAQIDLHNQDTVLYQIDFAAFNNAWDEAMAYWRRHNYPEANHGYRVM